MGTLIPVRLLSRYGLCNASEIAGFDPDTAAALIASGRAEPYVAAGEAATATETEQETEQGGQDEDPEKRQESQPDTKPGKKKKA